MPIRNSNNNKKEDNDQVSTLRYLTHLSLSHIPNHNSPNRSDPAYLESLLINIYMDHRSVESMR